MKIDDLELTRSGFHAICRDIQKTTNAIGFIIPIQLGAGNVNLYDFSHQCQDMLETDPDISIIHIFQEYNYSADQGVYKFYPSTKTSVDNFIMGDNVSFHYPSEGNFFSHLKWCPFCGKNLREMLLNLKAEIERENRQ